MKKGKRQIALWIMIGLGAMVFLVGGAFVLISGFLGGEAKRAAATLPKQLQRAKELRIPLSPEEIRPNPPIPAGKNAAGDYRKAVAVLAADRTATQTATTLGKYGTSGGNNGMAAGLIKQQGAWLKHIRAASNKPHLDFAYDYSKGPEVEFHEFAPLKNAVKILCGKAAYEARTGNTAGAIESMRQASMIAGHLAEEPTLIAHLVSIADEVIWHGTARQLIRERSRDRRFLNGMSSLLNKMKPAPSLKKALKGEAVITWVVMENLDYHIDRIPSYASGGDPSSESSQPNPLKVAKGSKMWEDAFKARHLEAWNEIFSWFPAKGEPDHLEITRRMDALIKTHTPKRGLTYTLNAILFPAFEQAGGAYLKVRADRELTKAMVAVYLHKLGSGRLPNSMSEVKGKFTDPYDKNSVRYRTAGAGFVLYCLGANLSDDGGDTTKESGYPRDIVATGS